MRKTVLEKISEKLSDITNYIIEKNQKTCQNNKLKMFIRNEKKIMDKEYNELGVYYYSNLRNESDKKTEQICKKIDNAKTIILNSQNELREINCCCNQSITQEKVIIDPETNIL